MSAALPSIIDGGEIFGLATVDDFLNGTPYGFDGYVGYTFRKTEVATTWADSAHMPTSLRPRWPAFNSVAFGFFWDNWTRRALDTFTGTNGTALHLHAMEIGGGWTEDIGTWKLLNNTAVLNSAAAANNFAVCDPGQADVSLICYATSPSSAFDLGIVFNYQDSSNWWMIEAGFGGIWHLYKSIGGIVTEITNGGTAATSTTYIITVTTAGDNIRIAINGTLLFNQTISNRQLKTATKAGIRVSSTDPGSSFDTFIVYGTPTPTPQTVQTNGLSVADKLCWTYTEDAVTFLLPEGQYNGRGARAATAADIAQVQAARTANPTKILIYNGAFTGGDELRPSPQYIANNISFLRAMPFDGTVIDVKSLTEGFFGPTALSYRLLSTDDSFDYNTISDLLAPLDGLDFGNLKYNYVAAVADLLGGNPGLGLGRIDFYDDDNWNIVLDKATNTGKVMAALGILGFWLDTEDYGGRWASYADQPDHDLHDIEDYIDKARYRGTQFLEALRTWHPAVSLISLVAPMFQSDSHPFYTNYELAGPFYQGMMEALPGNVRAFAGDRARFIATAGDR